jgi:site-specific DNA recombinase
MRAIIYCRVSTLEQVRNLSLPIQEKACREYCAREGYEVARVFVDRGESAKTTQRPEFQALLAFCRQHKASTHAVIVYGLSRFSRNSVDHHSIAAILRSQGIALRSVTEPIDDTPAGKFMEAILAGMAQFDNDLRADRTKVGMRAGVSHGRWVWKAPLGYRNGNTRVGEPSLVEDPARGPFVRQAFDLIAAGVSQSEMQRGLASLGLETTQRRPVSTQTWFKVLRNPLYVGRLVTGLGAERDGDWAPLVDATTWARVQMQLAGGVAGPRVTDAPDFPLRRFVHCGSCRRPLTGSWSRGKKGGRYAYYHCKGGCVTTPRAVLEEAFLSSLHELRGSPAYWEAVRLDVLTQWRTKAGQADAERGRLEARVRDVRSRLRRLDDAYLDDRAIDLPTYQERRGHLRAALDQSEVELQSATSETWDVEALLDYAIAVTQDAARLWTMAPDAPARVRLQWVLFPEGLIWDGSVWSNPGNCWSLSQMEAETCIDSRMASPAGVEPASPP